MERINLRYWNDKQIKALLPERFVHRELGDRLLEYLKGGKIICIYGPRQSGKSTLLGWIIHKLMDKGVSLSQLNYASMDYLDLHPLIQDTRRLVSLLREEAGGENRVYLLIDEVQRLKEAGLLLKQIYDAHQNIHIIVSGSSVLKLRERVREHLTGRKEEFILYPFNFLEFLRAKEALPKERIHRYKLEQLHDFLELYRERLSELWKEFVHTGGYPEMVLKPEMRQRLYSALFSSYIERDVGNLIRTGNYRVLQDFLRILAEEGGKIYNRSNISRILRRDPRTIESFEEILLSTFVIYKLTPFYTNIRKEIRKAPRFYFVDSGLRNYIAKEGKDISISGFVLENSIINELIYILSLSECNYHWWRSKGGAEVDFVIRCRNKTIPVEIKKGIFRKPKLTRSFSSFLNYYSPSRAFFITPNLMKKIYYEKTEVWFIPSFVFTLLEEKEITPK
jgi:hypothetical protein